MFAFLWSSYWRKPVYPEETNLSDLVAQLATMDFKKLLGPVYTDLSHLVSYLKVLITYCSSLLYTFAVCMLLLNGRNWNMMSFVIHGNKG